MYRNTLPRSRKTTCYDKRRTYFLLDTIIHILQACLFGSYVKGTADEWSDIDPALVTEDFIGDSFDFRFLLAKLGRDIDPDIEPHPYLLSEFNESNPIAGEILRNGERIV